MNSSFDSLAKQQFINLTTYRKTGQPVTTPVWFASEGDRLVGLSQPQTGKIKRIRNSPRVSVAPCTMNGKPLGEPIAGVARLLSPEEFAAAQRALKRKYGVQFRLLAWFSKVRGLSEVFWEVRPAG